MISLSLDEVKLLWILCCRVTEIFVWHFVFLSCRLLSHTASHLGATYYRVSFEGKNLTGVNVCAVKKMRVGNCFVVRKEQKAEAE